ncbi:MAG: PEP-CTERM sorting domain-containing protein [Phycisphaerae bacterium]|nr:PEP-CTERM sorting domain-containing protein [Phycisphaerae bacterium]
MLTALAALSGFGQVYAAEINASWIGPDAGGNWSTAANWSSTNYPNNNGDTYNVTLGNLDAAQPMTRTVVQDVAGGVTVDSLLIWQTRWEGDPPPDPWMYVNALRLDENLTTVYDTTVRGSVNPWGTALLDLGGSTLTAQTLMIEANGYLASEPTDPFSYGFTQGTVNGHLNNDGTTLLTGNSYLNGNVRNTRYFTYDSEVGNSLQCGTEIDNTGASAIMNLFGDTYLPLDLKNTNSAVLNYDAHVEVSSAGNLDNTDGIINGLGGNLWLRAWDQVNNGTINLSNDAQLTIGNQGTNTLTNNGVLSGENVGDPVGNSSYPVVNANLINYHNVFVEANTQLNINTALPVMNYDYMRMTNGVFSSPTSIMNYGNVLVEGPQTPDLWAGEMHSNDSIFNTGTITINNARLTADNTILNSSGGTITVQRGGFIHADEIINSATSTIDLTLAGEPDVLFAQADVAFTQAGTINTDEGHAFAVLQPAGTTFTNSGTINMNGVNLASADLFGVPDNVFRNEGSITGSGIIGGARTLPGGATVDKTQKFINDGIITVTDGQTMVLDGILMPVNNDRITVGAAGTLITTCGAKGGVFLNNGRINLTGAGLNDGGFGRALTNAGHIVGNGTIDYGQGILNNLSGVIDVRDPAATFLPLRLNPDGAPIVNVGTINIYNGSALEWLSLPGSNHGTINMYSTGAGARLTGGGATGSFTNTGAGVIYAEGMDHSIDFDDVGPGATSFTNEGMIRVGLAGGGPSSLAINAISGDNVRNTGTIDARNTTLAFGTGDLVNDEGHIIAQAGSTFTASRVINNLGQIDLAGSSTATITELHNTNGDVSVFGSSTLSVTDAAVQNTGRLTVVDDSTFNTNTKDLTNTGGSILVQGVSHWLNGADVTNDEGLIDIAGGSDAAIHNLTNTNGDITVFSGSGLTTWRIDNSGTLSIANASTLATGAHPVVNDGGNILVQGGPLGFSTWTTDADVTNTDGLIDIAGGSTATMHDLDNLLGDITVVGLGSLLDTLAVDNSGIISVRDFAWLDTLAVTNTGTISVLDSSTFNPNWSLVTNTGGSILVQGASAWINGGNVDNDGGLIDVAGGSTAFVDRLDNVAGDVTVVGGALLDTLHVENSGTISVRGLLSELNTTTIRNAGGTLTALDDALIETNGNAVTVDGGTLTTDPWSNAATGFIGVTGAGSIFNGGTGTNAGVIKVSFGGEFNSGGLVNTNTGTLDIDPAYATIDGVFELAEGSILRVENQSVLTVKDDWVNHMLDEGDFEFWGKLVLDGGTEEDPLLYELAGRNYGNYADTPAEEEALLENAYVDNFAIGLLDDPEALRTLEIAAGSYIRLADLIDNENYGDPGEYLGEYEGHPAWSGHPEGKECLYVYNLIIGDNVTIDFGVGSVYAPFHLYYFIGGDYSLGENVTFLPEDWMPLPIAVPEPATLLLLTLGGALTLRRRR